MPPYENTSKRRTKNCTCFTSYSLVQFHTHDIAGKGKKSLNCSSTGADYYYFKTKMAKKDWARTSKEKKQLGYKMSSLVNKTWEISTLVKTGN